MFDDDDWGDGIERNSPAGSTPSSKQDHRGLEEVERALSVLGGRHPEVVRAEREAREAAGRRSQELLAASRAARKQARKRLAIGVLVTLAIGGAGAFAYKRIDRSQKEEARIAPALVPYVARGFAPAPRGALGNQAEAEADVPAQKCVAILAAPDLGDVAVSIEHAGKTEVARGSGLFCTCASEHVKATAPGPVRILTIDDRSIGGLRAIDFLDPKPVTVLAGSEACGADAFAGWADSDRAPTSPVPVPPDAFAKAGFVGVTVGGPPFVIVPRPAADTCSLALGQADVSLEGGDGSSVMTGKTIGWCQSKPELHVLSSTGQVTVLSVGVRRVGGMLGLREVFARASATLGAMGELVTWAPDDDLGSLAQATLRASVVPDPTTVVGSLRADQAKDARVLSFAAHAKPKGPRSLELGTGPTYDADAKPGVFFSCLPTVEAPESVCVQSGALSWKPHSAFGATAAVAYGPLPPWMSALEAARTEDVVAIELRLVTLARVLSSRGFDPGIIEGITEKPRGVEVLGRKGEDSIVAIGIWPAPPWAVPYSDGPAWKLDDPDPRVIPIEPGAHLSLISAITPTAPEKTRRTVVFRHAIKR